MYENAPHISRRFREQPGRGPWFPRAQVAQRIGLPPDQGNWAFDGDRIAVRYAYAWRDDSGNWFRSYGNENWEFTVDGLMQRRFACINDMPMQESKRKFH